MRPGVHLPELERSLSSSFRNLEARIDGTRLVKHCVERDDAELGLEERDSVGRVSGY